MPTKTSAKIPSRPRRSAPTPGAGGRFSRSTPSTGGRFGVPTSSASKRPSRVPGIKPKSKGRSHSKGGAAGLLSSLAAAGQGKKGSSQSSKAKPALALVAAGAGAFLGRKQLQNRKKDEPTDEPTPFTTPVSTGSSATSAVNDTTTPQTGAPRATDTPSDAI